MNSAIIVAAGRGTRMGPNIDKLFLEVSGAPVVAHTWERFDETESIDEIIRRALAAVRAKGLVVTDDTAACELIGQPVQLVESSKPNPKVTVPADLSYIELLLR